MGQCYSKQSTQPLRTTQKQILPRKCIHIENPPSLVLQLTDGSIETISLASKPTNRQLILCISTGVYFSNHNQLFLIVKSDEKNKQKQGSGLNDKKIMNVLHSYYQVCANMEGFVEPDSIYYGKNQTGCYLLIKSKELGQKGARFVDLVDLGRKMKQKEICWQDLEFSSIINQIINKCATIKSKQFRISNVIIGSDGSVHLLSLLDKITSSSNKNIQALQQILLQSLYGTKIKKQSIPTLQQKSVFKHKSSLSQIQSLPYLIEEQRSNKNNKVFLIANPSLKFIKDYITAYHYKLQVFSFELVDALVILGQYQSALKLLDQYMAPRGYYNTVNEQTYQLYLKILQINLAISSKNLEVASAKARVSSAAYYLAKICKLSNRYKDSLRYLNDSFHYRTSKLEQSFYLQMAEVCRALNRNIQAESSLLEGLYQYPDSKILNLQLIIYICDCMRLDQAEQQLMKATPSFRTLQMQVSSAKIMLTKGILNQQKGPQYVKKAKQSLQKVILDQYQKQKGNNSYAMALYHEVFGDCYFQEHNFSSAREQYHISKILLKNEKACGYRLANITAAQANCLMMEGNFEEAINVYNQALSFNTQQSKTLMDSISGNKAIAKIKKGLVSQGRKQIQQILDSTPQVIIDNDYNYTFLRNVMKTLQGSGTL